MEPRIRDMRDIKDGKFRVWKDEEAEEHFGKPWCVAGPNLHGYQVSLTWFDALTLAGYYSNLLST